MSDRKYRIVREPKAKYYRVEVHTPGEGGYPETVQRQFLTIEGAQRWIDSVKPTHQESNFYQGEWQ